VTTPLDPALVQDVAARLADARAGHVPCAVDGALHRHLDEEEAYRVQRALLDLELARGAHLTGVKVGATSESAQQMLGCSGPFFGWLFESGSISAGGSVDISRLIRPRIECEVAFGLARDLVGHGVTADDVLAAAAWAAAAFEIIDCRVAGVQPSVHETIADNSSSAAYVLSDRRLLPGAVDFGTLTVVMARNGLPLVSGSSLAVMAGDPAASVAWLANRLAASGIGLTAGMVILTGAMAPAQPAAPGDLFQADFGALGELGVAFRDLSAAEPPRRR
jgi:2-oxopent-4-enoate/cis-2-oxohex-4-enoate hydratase